MDKAVIIFSGFNQRAVIAFIRTLVAVNVPFAIIAKSEKDTIFSTIYKDHVVAVRKSVELVLTDVLNCIKKIKDNLQYKSFVIAPSSENLNRFLLKHKEQTTKYNCEIPLVDISIYENISDKLKFSKLCDNFGIPIPEEISDQHKSKLPFVAKPKNYIAADGNIHNPYLIFNEENKKDFLKNCNPSDFYYQKYLNGRSFYLLFYFSKAGKVHKYSQENKIQQADGKSIIGAISSDIHHSSQFEIYERLLLSLGFHGLLMIEVINVNDKYYMIEANPRFWGPSQLFADAGINLFIPFLKDQALLDMDFQIKESKKEVKYFWFGGIIDNIKRNKNLKYYSIKENELLNELPSWIESDIYRRDDTNKIYSEELFHTW